MNGRTTRKAFIGGGAALAVGVGAAKLPHALTAERHTMALDAPRVGSSGGLPAFGTVLPTGSPDAGLNGALVHRGTARPAGHLSIATVPSDGGSLRVHSLELHDGTIVAVGPAAGPSYAIASGTRRYAKAHGSITVRSAGAPALALDVELEL
jgi:hypothetical protein